LKGAKGDKAIKKKKKTQKQVKRKGTLWGKSASGNRKNKLY